MIEISKILSENDFSRVIEYNNDVGRQLSRTECEAIVQEAIGKPIPDNNVRFLVHTANDKWFLIIYVKNADKFLYEKLTAR